MLAEATTTEISKREEPEGFEENRRVAKRGGGVAHVAQKALEEETGVPVVTSQNAAQLNTIVTQMIETVVNQQVKELLALTTDSEIEK